MKKFDRLVLEVVNSFIRRVASQKVSTDVAYLDFRDMIWPDWPQHGWRDDSYHSEDEVAYAFYNAGVKDPSEAYEKKEQISDAYYDYIRKHTSDALQVYLEDPGLFGCPTEYIFETLDDEEIKEFIDNANNPEKLQELISEFVYEVERSIEYRDWLHESDYIPPREE